MATWKRDAASGLVVLIPILVTLFVVYWLYSQIAGIPVLQETFPNPAVRVLVVLVVFVLLVFAVGYLMRTAVGGYVEQVLDTMANRLPGLRIVYNASKMAVETALTGTDELQKPVKLEPVEGYRMTAFKTGKTTEDGREVLFMPTAPNITTGYVLEIPEEQIIETGETVEDALTRVLSAGFGEARDEGVRIDITEIIEQGDGTSDDQGRDGGADPSTSQGNS
ncbi:MAG: DUF502 domain-containing protein [Halobacteriaceae archaeon]